MMKMDLIKRTEVLSAEKDLKAIRKALENISDKIAPVSKETNVVVANGLDPFFGKIHMSEKHMDAWNKEFDYIGVSLVGLMEECAELQQAASKYYREYRYTDHAHCSAERAAMIEEMAHVLIDIRMICHALEISPEDIQKEIMKKYPGGYLGKEDYYADNAKYVSVDCSCD
jgi:NTP pyrophosphatase (non-canonical NTP hydrolase)